MFDIGIGEILIVAVIGLLVFGPERLPRAAADAAKWLKQIRVMPAAPAEPPPAPRPAFDPDAT